MKKPVMKGYVSVPALTSSAPQGFKLLNAGPYLINTHEQLCVGAIGAYSCWEFDPIWIVEELTEEILNL